MAKRAYIPVCQNGRNYKIYLQEVVKVHSIAKKTRPPVPAYSQCETVLKTEDITDIEF